MVINLPHLFEARPYQVPLLKAFDEGFKRLIQVWHRRSGKDKVDVNLVAREMQENSGIYYYFFPTYSQGKKALWEGRGKDGVRYIDHFPAELVTSINQTEMKINYKNGSIFQIIGTDNIDSIVGTNPRGCVFSEYSLQNPKVWQFIRPILKENGGWAIFNFTPRGKNHAFDLLEMAKKFPQRWFHQVLTVEDTGVLTLDDIQEEREEGMSEEMIQQEYYCSFMAAVLGSYYHKEYTEAEQAGQFGMVPYDPALPVHTVWDLGISDTLVIGFYQTVGLERRKIDCLDITGKGLPDVIKMLRDKPYVYGKHFAPHDIKVRELGTGKSRLEVAKALNFEFQVVPNIPVQDGIDAGRRFFKKLRVDKDKCKMFLKAIPQYSRKYDDKNKVFLDYPNHDWTSHFADEHRYAALIEEQMTNEVQPQSTYKQPAPEPSTQYGA